jgi:hypothetical protein
MRHHNTLLVIIGLAGALVFSACRDLTNLRHDAPSALIPVESIARANPGDTVTVAVRVVDGLGRSVADVPVTWAVIAGGGTITPVASTTDHAGVAAAEWALGMEEGSQRARATSSGLGGIDFVVDTSPLTPD